MEISNVEGAEDCRRAMTATKVYYSTSNIFFLFIRLYIHFKIIIN